MISPTLFSLLAMLCLVPAALQPWLPGARRGVRFWGSLLLALAGPLDWTLWQMSGQWPTALAADLWISISLCLVLFAVVCALHSQAWRLTVLMLPYLLLLGLLATLSSSYEGNAIDIRAPTAWIDSHILVSLGTLGLLTLAAAAALACFIQARALKNKHPNRLSRLLPSVSDSERLYETLLIWSEVILAIGVATGMATEKGETGHLLIFDHKTLFSLAAFVLIFGLITGRHWGGVRGQWAVRLALVAYSFVLLGYFGVKFVRQVLLS